ncbi:FAD-dependent oxidoreductase [Desulfothermus sp.]
MNNENLKFDAIVIGGGIAGLQAAIDLGDQGYKVAIIEKNPSIGGNMIRLSKVFPTLDCASCITTPKMAQAAHHKNITLYTYTEVKKLSTKGNKYVVGAVKKPRFVDEDKCIGCRQCEINCPVLVPDPEQGNFVAKKAISIPFSNAIPQIAYLDTQWCMLCGKCAKVCPKDAVDYFQKPINMEFESDVVIMATGFKLTSLADKRQYGQGKLKNVITSLQMERLLAPHGPYNRVLRPSDGKEPESIAFIQCAGSRDKSMGIEYCSRICCMYSIKQAMLLSGALPLADLTIYNMDIRAFGKGYEQFYQNAIAMGIEFVRAKVAYLTQGEEDKVIVHFEDQTTGEKIQREHDLVVLALGAVPEMDNLEEFQGVSCGYDNFIHSINPNIDPALLGKQGIYGAGCCIGPKDIVDTISEAGNAAMQASIFLARKKEEK